MSDIKQIEKTVHEYGRVQVEVMQDVKAKYPAFVFPQSLLPYSKEEIREALDTSILLLGDGEIKEALKASAVVLDCFIDDKEASAKNAEVLKSINRREGTLPNLQFLELDGNIFRLSTAGDKLFLEMFDKPSSSFQKAPDTFTGRDLFDAKILSFEKLPLEVQKTLK